MLRAALRGEPCEEDLGSILDILLEKQTALSSTSPRCVMSSLRKPSLQTAKLSLFEAESTPQTDSISHEWREHLIREMSRNTNCQYESTTRIFGEVCRDLELRCNEAERPLRDEQSKSRSIQARLEGSQAKVAELESQIYVRTSQSEAMKMERNKLKDQVSTSDERLRNLQTSHNQTCQEFDQAKADAERAARHATEAARQQDLAYLATMTGKDAMFEEQAAKLARSEGRVADQEHELAQLEAQASRDVGAITEQNAVNDDLRSAVVAANDMAASRQVDIDRLIESERALNASTEELAAKLQEVSDRNDLLISNLKQELQAAEVKTSELLQEHDAYASAKGAEILRLEESHQNSIEGWRTKLKEARNEATIAARKDASAFAELQGKNKRLREELEEHDKEFSEAQEHFSRFMAAIPKRRDWNTYTGSAPTQSGERQGELPLLETDSPD